MKFVYWSSEESSLPSLHACISFFFVLNEKYDNFIYGEKISTKDNRGSISMFDIHSSKQRQFRYCESISFPKQ